MVDASDRDRIEESKAAFGKTFEFSTLYKIGQDRQNSSSPPRYLLDLYLLDILIKSERKGKLGWKEVKLRVCEIRRTILEKTSGEGV